MGGEGGLSYVGGERLMVEEILVVVWMIVGVVLEENKHF